MHAACKAKFNFLGLLIHLIFISKTQRAQKTQPNPKFKTPKKLETETFIELSNSIECV